MFLVVFVFACTMLQCAICGDYFVQLKSHPDDSVTPREYLSTHLTFLKKEIPDARVYQVHWTLAERFGFYGYCVAIDDVTRSIKSLSNFSKIVKAVEQIGLLSVAETDTTLPVDTDVDHTLSPFRKNRMAKSEVNLDYFYSTEADSRCVYNANMFLNMVQLPPNISAVHNSSNPVFTYVLDTGIQSTHHSFEGTVEHGFDFENRSLDHDGSYTSFERDPHGHGTQVAGLLHQVCPYTRLVDVRVLGRDGFGRIDDIVRGLEYVVEHYFSNVVAKGRLHSVINLSFSGPSSAALKSVLLHVSKVLLVIGASGDEDAFSCEASPSSSEFILAVGGSTWRSDFPLPQSNYGSCVRVRVAAENILTPYIGESDSEMRGLSGSSAAAAFLSGVAARFISVVQAMPRAADALYTKFPGPEKQREMVEFVIEILALPAHLFMTGAHSVYFPPCTLFNITYIQETLVQLLQLNVEQPLDVTSAGGRRAMLHMKNRFKVSQRQKLERNYD